MAQGTVLADASVAPADKAEPLAKDKPFTCQCTVDYGSPEHAEMVMKALSVDKELRPQQVVKTFRVEGSSLTIHFAATDVRTLRSAVGSLCDLMALATRTIEAFG